MEPEFYSKPRRSARCPRRADVARIGIISVIGMTGGEAAASEAAHPSGISPATAALQCPAAGECVPGARTASGGRLRRLVGRRFRGHDGRRLLRVVDLLREPVGVHR